MSDQQILESIVACDIQYGGGATRRKGLRGGNDVLAACSISSNEVNVSELPKPAIIQIGDMVDLDTKKNLVFLSKMFMETFGPKYRQNVQNDIHDRAIIALREHWKTMLSTELKFAIIMKFTRPDSTEPVVSIGIDKMIPGEGGSVWIKYFTGELPTALAQYANSFARNTLILNYNSRLQTSSNNQDLIDTLLSITQGLQMATPTNIADEEINITPLYQSIQYYQKIASNATPSSAAAVTAFGGRKKMVKRTNTKRKSH